MAKRASGDRDRFMKFYPSDWRGDDELQACSIGARGMWMELMCLAHKYGGVVLIAGVVPADADIARQAKVTKAEAVKYIGELLARGVASRRPEDGALFSRRMVRDARKREINKQNGEKGGNPALTGLFDGHADDSVAGSVGDSVNRFPNPQIPDTRNQRSEHQQHRSRSKVSAPTHQPFCDVEVEGLVTKAGIKRYDQSRWFTGAFLVGDTLHLASALCVEWVAKHYRERLEQGHGGPLEIVLAEEAVSA